MKCRPGLTQLRLLSAAVAAASVATLAACGGGDDDTVAPIPTAATPAPAPAPAASTTVTGAVVKGPVAAAQVCAFTVSNNARGTGLGSCTTTDAAGNYSLTVPVGSGALWLEATGGSYTDEVSAALRTLPAGSPLVALAAANGTSVVNMLTPLTTLALNAARASVASSGTLDAVAYQAAVTALLSSFNLPTTLNINTTLPAFGAGINSYGSALTAISQMVANGESLATLLASAQPAALANAFARAAAPPVVVVPNPTPPVAAANFSTATGTLALAGANAVVASHGNFTPQENGFSVTVASGAEAYSSNLNLPSKTTYRFLKFVTDSAGVASTVQLTVVRGSATSDGSGADNRTTYSVGATVVGSCDFCASFSTPAAAKHPVTVTFNNARLAADLTLNGSLVGNVTGGTLGALWLPVDLPGTTTGNATMNGADLIVSDAIVNNTNDGAKFLLVDGRALEVLGNTANYYGPLGVYSCFSNCGITAVANTGGGATFTFTNTRLGLPNNGLADPNGRTLNGSITVGKSSGSLTTTSLGAFAPTTTAVQAVNGAVTTTYTRSANGEGAGVVSIDVASVGRQVQSVLVKLGFAGGGQTYACTATASANVPACSGISLSSNNLTVTFTSAVLGGSMVVNGAVPSQTFSGAVVAKGR